ncbi:hypothetical protein [Sporomusa acidovorans]|uniref:Chromosome partition protein Smc n=1 Tax=Sporomusa acidovorans (strain ATCC 49682 / DSM 3132 / Mol) TaxID=1123286 RepID=A0ABZ3IX51_SPOA4|nr:hypothetical protein [Sporomusa acidovorans]OZC23661.1 hypothetical protein SPACI_05630 [Sporomusa acidovorans DSM 3132]SDE24255.1 hypothetical protein SAMN04488499_101089 [Sporomusa acidovorans]
MENQELLQAIRSVIQEEVNPIKEEIKSLKEGQQQTNKRLDRIESDMASERQQIEISQIVHGLRHNSEEVNAQLHNLGHNLNVLTGKAATKEDMAELNAKLEVLNSRQFQQEAAIHQLKAVK